MKTLYRRLKATYTSILRVLAWLPIIWRDRDWDYAFLEQILKFKLKRMADCIEKNNLIEANLRVAKQIRYAVYLLDRIESREDEEKSTAAFQKKWGEPKYSFDELDDRGLRRFVVRYPNTDTPELKEQWSKEFLEKIHKDEAKVQELYDRLFRHISKYLQKWWD